MADSYPGVQKIGSLLFGGANRIKSQAYEEGRLTTAKTEQALATARESQLKAKAAETKIREAENFEANAVANGMPATQAHMIGGLIRAEAGSDYHAGMQGEGERQEQGFRETMADVNAPAEKRLRASQAQQGTIKGDFAPIGTQGVVDLTKDDQELLKGPGTGTTAQKNFEYSQGLPPEQRDDFSPFVRADQVLNTGNVPTVRRATTGSTQTPVSAADVASNAATVQGGKKTADEVVKLRKEYPQAKFTLGRMNQDIDMQQKQIEQIAAQRKLWQSFGLGQKIAAIPGTDGANIRGLVETLQSQLMLNTLISLRSMSKTGGAVGNVSDREGFKMETARANLSNPDITVGQVLSELDKLGAYNVELKGLLQTAFDETYDEKGEPRLSATLPGAAGESLAPEGGEGNTIEELIINNGDGEYDESGNLVRSDGSGWTLETDAAGNKAWVSPDRTQYEEVAQ